MMLTESSIRHWTRTAAFGLIVLICGCNKQVEQADPVRPEAKDSVASADRSGRKTSEFEQGVTEFKTLYESEWPDVIIDEGRDAESGQVVRVYSPSKLRERPGNHPKILHHGKRTEDVVVLIHGITDSPYYMEAIGKEFHKAGFNVLLPLLPAHGSTTPWSAMRDLEYRQWIKDIDQVMRVAQKLGHRVSMGGFSTGGALTVEKVTRDPESVSGGIFLFSAALDIGFLKQAGMESAAGELIGRLADDKLWAAGEVKKVVQDKVNALRGELPEESREDSYGIGDNPYKYSVFFYEGAAQLALVIAEVNDRYGGDENKFYRDITQPVFLAHSKTDQAAQYAGAVRLYSQHPNEARELFTIEELPHASVVLDREIDGDPKAVANPQFEEMTSRMLDFAAKYVVGK